MEQAIGHRLKELRLRHRLSQRQLARQSGRVVAARTLDQRPHECDRKRIHRKLPKSEPDQDRRCDRIARELATHAARDPGRPRADGRLARFLKKEREIEALPAKLPDQPPAPRETAMRAIRIAHASRSSTGALAC